MKTRLSYLPLVIIIILALAVRLYKINAPLADWHSFRQADTASVTREYLKHGLNLMVPHYHDLSNIQSGKDNPEGYRMVEFPFVNGLTVLIIRLFSLSEQQVLIGRLVSVIFSLLTLISIYILGLKLSGKTTAIIAAASFALLPYSVFYSRVILPEPAFLALSTFSLVCFCFYLEKDKIIFYLLSLITFSLALLVKPYAVFLYPLFFALTFYFSGKIFSRKMLVSLLIPLSFLPLLYWRNWITQFPTGVPASDWLYNQNNIRFKGAFFHWLFEVRLSTLILGIGAVVPVFLGLIKKGNDSFVYLIWLFCLLIYATVFAGGNIQHDYYQIIFLPLLCLLIGRGTELALNLSSQLVNRLIVKVALLSLMLLTLFVSWYQVRNYYLINHQEIILAGQAVDKLTPKDAKVIAPYNGDTAFLFQTNRTGWPIGFYIDEKIKLGANYYVSVNYDNEARELEAKYETVEKNDRYLILNLSKTKAL